MAIKNVICDIDGVLMHDNVAVPGAAEFLTGILEKGLPLVLLTNYPSQTGQDLANRFATAGVNVPDSVFYTSAMATADFLRRQEGKKAYVVGEGALIHELYKAGFTITDVNPDFVIVGETRSYNWDMMHKAAYFVANGARFIATNRIPTVAAFIPPVEHSVPVLRRSQVVNHFMSANPARGLFARRSTKCRRTQKKPSLLATTCAPIFWQVFRRVWKLSWYCLAYPSSMILTTCRSDQAGFTRLLLKLM